MNGFITILTAVISFGVTAMLGRIVIPFLRRLKYGQTILDIGPKWHKNKQGTPTMGGIMFIIGILLASIVAYCIWSIYDQSVFSNENRRSNIRMFAGVLMAVAFGLMGFFDDYIKVIKKQNLGLTAKQKLVFQVLIAALYLFTLYIFGDTSTVVMIPFLGQFDFSFIYYPFALLLIVGYVNAVNITDGIDGLAASVTFVAAMGFMIMASLLKLQGMNILSTALAGGCMGFLMWNFHPAKVFMGDTGSMFLGGLVVALAFGLGMPLLLLLVGIIYLIEAASVTLQVASFKLTGKRIFKMSPIHHHFEMSGWSEVKIVMIFSAITVIGCIAAISAVILG